MAMFCFVLVHFCLFVLGHVAIVALMLCLCGLSCCRAFGAVLLLSSGSVCLVLTFKVYSNVLLLS
jgi:hypothetical protein